jgi:hypothetical protein
MSQKQTSALTRSTISPVCNAGDFPDVLIGAAGEFAKVYSSCVEVPPQFFFMAYLTCLGNIVSDQIDLASFNKSQPRFYTLLLGKSGTDRKSTAISKTVEFFKSAHVELHVCRGASSAEGLQKMLERNKRLLLFLDEFKQFLGKCRIETSVLLPCVNSLFEDNNYEAQTSKRDIRLSGVYLSLLGASTVATYENTWSKQFTDIGFNNRLFLVTGSAERRFSIPPNPPEGAEDKLRDNLRSVLRFAQDHRKFDLTPDAKQLYDRWYMSMSTSVHAVRLDTYALRFMPLLAINSLKPVIDEQIVQAVIALCDYQLAVRKTYDPIDADSQLAALEEKIRRVLGAKGPLTERDLKRAIHVKRCGLGLYDQAMEKNRKHGYISWNKAEKRYYLVELA